MTTKFGKLKERAEAQAHAEVEGTAKDQVEHSLTEENEFVERVQTLRKPSEGSRWDAVVGEVVDEVFHRAVESPLDPLCLAMREEEAFAVVEES